MSLSKSRFIEMFDKENKEVSLKDCCEIHARIGWQALTQKEHMKSGEYVLVTGTDFVNNAINFDSCVYVKKERYEMDPHIILKENDILVTKDGTIGKVAIVKNLPKPATLNSGIFVIRPDRRFDKDYIAYVFKGPIFEHFVDSVKTGATIKHLNQNKLVEFKIPVPTLKKQEEFSLFCHHLDKSKFLLQKILEKLELLKKSRFIEMFDLYKEKKLSEVAEIIMGQSPDSNSYNNTEMGLPFYQGKTEFSDKYIGSPVTWCSSPCRIAEKNDILMSVRAPVGDVNIATEKCCIGRGLASIRPLDGESTFLFYALKLKKAEIASKGNGSTFKAINKETVHSITIPDVPQELKVKFSMFAEQIDKSKFIYLKTRGKWA